MSKVLNLTKQLIKFNSSPGKSNKALADFIISKLKQYFVKKVTSENLSNLIFKIPGQSQKNPIIFLCHQDTVAPSSFWKQDPCKAEIRGNILIGLGASDMKGGISTLICAINQLKNIPPQDVFVLFTSDEESSGKGIDFIKKTLNLENKNGLVIATEPTDGMLRIGQMGVLELEIKLSGASGHAALANKKYNEKNNPLYRVNKIMDYLMKLETELAKKNNKEYGSPIMNIGALNCGTAANTIPDRCLMKVSFRLLPDMDVLLFEKKIYNDIKKICKDAIIKTIFSGESFASIKDANFKKISAIAKKNLGYLNFHHSASWTEVAHLKAGNNCIVFGPGTRTMAHKAGESINIDLLEKFVSIYYQIITK